MLLFQEIIVHEKDIGPVAYQTGKEKNGLFWLCFAYLEV